MTIVTTLDVRCDVCGITLTNAAVGTHVLRAQARARAARYGWTRRRWRRLVADLCERCSVHRETSRAAR